VFDIGSVGSIVVVAPRPTRPVCASPVARNGDRCEGTADKAIKELAALPRAGSARTQPKYAEAEE